MENQEKNYVIINYTNTDFKLMSTSISTTKHKKL